MKIDQYELGENLKQVYFEKLKFCGCGRPEDTMLFIKQLLNIIDARRSSYTYDEYQHKLREVFQFENRSTEIEYFTNIQEGIIQFIFYYLDEIGIVEHGSGIRGSWLTDEGKQLCNWLNAVENFETIMD